MITITMRNQDGHARTLHGEAGLSLMEVAVRNGIDGIEASCGGACSCATCMVYVDESWRARLVPRSEFEEDMLELAFEADETSRLACQIRLGPEHDGLVVTVPGEQT
ncbi:ferredoxin [Fulvimarina pelagi HTCC2506]|uniref:Ferredoxin n=1 Tax=Fulvimarina pelagi HTCC2506 TaxID=314231 RepID=Q0G3G5_9HYPH|nr:2Fe-2S iron-sulfur cluster-binding protein [Fulvimarina pelagi]EAU41866.1 ferredoxin [Fulvimarina pelagi HTCC2506]